MVVARRERSHGASRLLDVRLAASPAGGMWRHVGTCACPDGGGGSLVDRARRSLLVIALTSALAVGAAPAHAAVTLPPGFSDELVTSIGAPTALAFTPDGRTLITTQPGRLVVFNGSTQTTVLDLTSRDCSDSERGLLGVAVDPGFALNRFIYLFWT